MFVHKCTLRYFSYVTLCQFKFYEKTMKFLLKTVCVSLCYSIRSEILNLCYHASCLYINFYRACSLAILGSRPEQACWLFTNCRSLLTINIWTVSSSSQPICRTISRCISFRSSQWCDEQCLSRPSTCYFKLWSSRCIEYEVLVINKPFSNEYLQSRKIIF